MVKKKANVFFADILYWALVTCGTLYIILIHCSGYVRGYVLIGIVAGFTMFRILLSQITFNLIYAVFLLIRKIVLVLTFPFMLLERFAKTAVKMAARPLARVLRAIKTKKNQKKPPKPPKRA